MAAREIAVKKAAVKNNEGKRPVGGRVFASLKNGSKLLVGGIIKKQLERRKIIDSRWRNARIVYTQEARELLKRHPGIIRVVGHLTTNNVCIFRSMTTKRQNTLVDYFSRITGRDMSGKDIRNMKRLLNGGKRIVLSEDVLIEPFKPKIGGRINSGLYKVYLGKDEHAEKIVLKFYDILNVPAVGRWAAHAVNEMKTLRLLDEKDHNVVKYYFAFEDTIKNVGVIATGFEDLELYEKVKPTLSRRQREEIEGEIKAVESLSVNVGKYDVFAKRMDDGTIRPVFFDVHLMV